MATYIGTATGLQIESTLHDFVEREGLVDLEISPELFWATLAGLIDTFSARNWALLQERENLQAAIDQWHLDRRDRPFDASAYKLFLKRIGYIMPTGASFEVTTADIDEEIAVIAGPQLVVPASNARYALNAANARWGSLYDALYGTDALGSEAPHGPYDPERGARVIAWARRFLDDVVPLAEASHVDVVEYQVADGRLAAELRGGGTADLCDPTTFVGVSGVPSHDGSIVLRHNGLAIVLVVDRASAIGEADAAGISDIVLESAVTTIIDLEDSVAAVDGEDKAAAYRTWLGLMRGDLTAEVSKAGSTQTRRLAADRTLVAPDGTELRLRGRSLLLVRNVGHLMTTPAVLDASGDEVHEGLVDALVTVVLAMHDRNRPLSDRNSRRGSIYVVKPKMHGPREVEFACDVFAYIEHALGLPQDTVKLGIMDEERRTTVNLPECIRHARSRVAFINTGFLDRTGDEIHTSMEAGAMVCKADMRSEAWIRAYEDWNVDVGLACGLRGRAQIGKGMWAAPDRMADMLDRKISHPESGASCAWVPSPTAATLHATHYHRVDVAQRQAELAGRARATVDALLQIPLGQPAQWTDAARRAEVENNVQGILGYVVRWIDHGIGCSKVPDIHDVGLMEDRATCRISSQHVANWLHHGVVSHDEVLTAFERMAAVVDAQNASDPLYQPMAPDFNGIAFLAARDLVFQGRAQPSGYTEPILHERRRRRKSVNN